VKTDVTIYGTARLRLEQEAPGDGTAEAISTDGCDGMGAAAAQGHITMAYPINTIWMAPTDASTATGAARRALPQSTDAHTYAIGYSRHPHGGRGLKQNRKKEGGCKKCRR